MNLHRRNFLLAVTLATAAATPAFGQVTPTVGAASSGKQGAASVPDFSGVWTHSIPGFEPLASGPTALVNRSRRQNGTGDNLQLVGDYTNPILKPQAAEVVKRNAERELGGAPIPNPHNQCWPEPTPFTLNIQFGMRIIQRKNEVLLLYLSDHQVRRVRMNVPHAAHPTPTWQGESVGHYEGDTLVVDTIGQKIGPLSMIDRFGTPFSAGMRVIERYRLIDGALAQKLQLKHEHDYFLNGSPFRNAYGMGDIDPDTRKPGLQIEITVDDPATFTTPWSGLVTYRPVLGDWPEVACAENTQGSGSSWVVLVPRADKPDF